MTSPLASAPWLVFLALIAACGSTPSPPGPLQNVGGSAGSGPDASASGTSGSGGSRVDPALDAGASGDEPDADALDASLDARAPDADGAAVESGCVLGTLDSDCEDGCPDLDEAAEQLFAGGADAAVRRPCRGSDGTRYITIGSGSAAYSSGYIFAAASGALVATYASSTVSAWCADASASGVAFYGRVVHDCAAVNPDGVTAACDSSGPGSGGDPQAACILYSDD